MFTALFESTDERLVARALAGSDTAWRALVARYQQRIYNYALRLVGNPDDAADLLQEVLVALHRNLPTWRQDGSFPAWLFRIANYRCTDFLRRRRPRDDVAMLDDLASEAEGPERVTQIAGANARIVRALAGLPLDQRLVVEMKFFQQLTFEEIADSLGISPNTAKTRLYAALRKLRQHEELSHAL